MSLFRIQDKTPEVYTSTSRDFQLIGRLYDCIINGVKFDIDSILDIINTDFIDSKLLKLLQTKLGFFSNKYITDDDLRYILKAFPFIIKNKGSMKGIEQAVSMFLKINGIKSKVRVEKTNESLSHPYVIQISLDASVKDTTILDEVFKYILPTGYDVQYKFLNDIGSVDLLLESKIGANIVIIKDSLSSLVRGNYIEYSNPIENRLIGSLGETQISSPYDITFMGLLEDTSLLPNYIDDPLYASESYLHIGEVYIIKPDQDMVINNETLSYWIFKNDTSISGNVNGWVRLQGYDEDDPNSDYAYYRAYNSSYYGYYNPDDGKFYSKKETAFIDLPGDPQETDLKIVGADPYMCTIVPNYTNTDNNYSPRYLFDYDYGNIWISNEVEWESKLIKTYGVEVIGEDLDDLVYIVPKEGLIAYRKADSEYNVKEAIWTTSLSVDNKFSWNSIILDPNIINQYLPNPETREQDASVTIEGTPLSAIILNSKDNYIYNENKSWFKNNNDWEEIKRFEISGDPNRNAYIYPIYLNDLAITVSNGTDSWIAEIDEYSEELGTGDYENDLKPNILYIDKSTSNGYSYNESENKFEEVMYFNRADKVYKISEEEFLYMLENGLIKPAFKNRKIIFNDIYKNIFLL